MNCGRFNLCRNVSRVSIENCVPVEPLASKSARKKTQKTEVIKTMAEPKLSNTRMPCDSFWVSPKAWSVLS